MTAPWQPEPADPPQQPRRQVGADRPALGRGRSGWRQPAKIVVTGYLVAILAGAALLMLPGTTESGERAGLMTALFTATSAICIVGLVVEDTSTYWSALGEVMIMCLAQLGGIGIMTVASLLTLLVARRMGLRMELGTQTERKALGPGEVRRVVASIVLVGLAIEVAAAVVLTGRLWLRYDEPFGHAAYVGMFHAVSAFNNAGFSLYGDSLTSFVADPYINVTIMITVVAGAIGFPVLFELGRRFMATRWWPRRRARRRWTLHFKITVLTYVVLLVLGAIAITALEWDNPATMGPLGVASKVLAGMFHSVAPRSVGLNTLDVGAMHPATKLVNDVLMFIGGGSAGTGGGIKVTTFALLGYVILAEIRGEPTVHVMGRRIGAEVQRQALAVALLTVGAVVVSTGFLLTVTSFRLDDVLFEVISAVCTVGLSTGITGDLPAAGQLLLVVLMVIGRIGPITLASSLALRERARRYELPEERPIVG